MIGKHIEDFLYDNTSELMLEASAVATVGTENTLLHALMVLSSVGYSSIPVTDNLGFLKGILSLAMIINGVKDTENYEWDQLAERQVKEVMEVNPPLVLEGAELEDILHLLVDDNYLCVVDRNGKFAGIITRKSMFKKINHFAHEFELTHEVKRIDEERIEAAIVAPVAERRSAASALRSIW